MPSNAKAVDSVNTSVIEVRLRASSHARSAAAWFWMMSC